MVFYNQILSKIRGLRDALEICKSETDIEQINYFSRSKKRVTSSKFDNNSSPLDVI